MLWQGRSVRKPTGGRYRLRLVKRRREIGSAPTESHIGIDKRAVVRITGGNVKVRTMRAEYANVADQDSGTVRRAKIENVEENVANPNYVRRSLLTKGTVIKTDIGRARIVSRPGQEGGINAVLIK